ncbi:hypothetical protein P4E94_19810 [Pontiellaceae bacterium B12219]|nr:hypothetical protein [Pontiellaceae bacterium B12219]
MKNHKRKLLAIGFAAMAATAPVFAQGEITVLDSVVTEAEGYVTYGITAFTSLLGLGLAIVGASWAYKKIKAAIRSN